MYPANMMRVSVQLLVAIRNQRKEFLCEAVYFVKGLELVHPGGYLYPFDGVLHGDVAGIEARAFYAFSLVGEYLGLAQ